MGETPVILQSYVIALLVFIIQININQEHKKNIIPISFQNQSMEGETITAKKKKNEGILKANLHKAWASTAIPSAYHFTQQKLQKKQKIFIYKPSHSTSFEISLRASKQTSKSPSNTMLFHYCNFYIKLVTNAF